MRIIITGASGNLGLTIANLKSNHEFIPIGRGNWHQFISQEINDIDAVIHCAYDLKHKITEDPDLIIESNVLTTTQLLKYIKKNRIPKLIFISSCAVYGSNSDTNENNDELPESINGIVKLLNERIISDFCENSKINYTILRVFNLYGGDDHFSVINHLFNSLKSGNPFTLNNNGISRRDFIHVGDVARVILKVLESQIDHRLLNVGTGKSVSISEIVQFISLTKPLTIAESSSPEIEYSRANIAKLRTFYTDAFIDIFEYLELELKKRFK